MKKALLFLAIFSLTRSFAQSVSIGDILCTDGSTVCPEQFASSGKTAMGIVFYVDNSEQRGWAVNLHNDADDTNWVSPEHYGDGYDIPELPNLTYSRDDLFDLNGYQNTAIIRASHDADWYPAAWAVDFDHGWYLPSAGQLRWLIAYVNEVNASIAVANGAPLAHANPNWYWSSTEQDAMHAIVVSEGGSTANYMKWNYYNTSTIGVRSIRDFSIAKRDRHLIGDVVVTEGGQKGIVYYVSPEDDSYWLVALNDLPQPYAWGGNQDIADLQNYENDWYELHGVHCGYDATLQIRTAQASNPNYAASHVNFDDGWHIPSVGQLSKLFAALPHIEEQLIDQGGVSPSGDYYWTSTERNAQEAWTVNFGGNVYQEGAIRKEGKDNLHSVRPVWSLPCEVIPPTPEPSYPDNVIESDCNQPWTGNAWDAQLLASSPQNDIASYAPILAGDIDDNGVVDLVISHYNGNNYRSNTLDVYSGIDLSLQYRFNIQDSIYHSNGPYALGKYPKPDGSLQGAIFVHGYDKKIRSYTIDGTLLNVSDRATSCDGMVSFADFNGDGYPEVYTGSDIFDAATLKWLCSGPASGNKGLSFRGAAVGVVNHHRCYYTMSLASNVLGDERQELICGNTIYDVNIVSRTNPAQNSITVNKTITPPSGFPQDGHVSLADLDLDGECEVLVVRDDTDDHTQGTAYYYAYRPSDGQILFHKTNNCLCEGYPLIGNIDDDPHPEIVFLEKQNYPPMYIYCWRYTTQEGLKTIWSYQHEDTSGQTGITLFDFNQDGIMEIVYRDSQNLRIINGNTSSPHNVFSRRMAAGTGTEYPIVADINGDGCAEIVATGLLDQYSNLPGHGAIHVFGCPGNWSPARPVWNQYMYHVTNVNEDLTIPTSCFNKATIFTAPDGTVRRPFNNFLQQAYYITPEGEPYNPGGSIEVDIVGSGCHDFTFHGITYDESGHYEQLIESTEGCDTLYNIEVDLGQAITHEFWQRKCDSYTWNGSTYTESGNYTQQFVTPEDCDSIVTLHLTIIEVITHEWSAEACDRYTWNGITYTEPGDYEQEFESYEGCDSIVTLHLTFSHSIETETDITACDSFEWAGQELTQSGQYDHLFVTPGGCDSLVHLHLTVKPYPAAVGPITGPTEVNVSTDLILGQYFYSIDSVGFADRYEWEIDGIDWPMDTSGLQCALWVTTPGDAILRVKAWNGCGYTEREILIHAGFFDLDEMDIRVSIYPNPTHDHVSIEAEDIRRVRMYDLQGQCLWENTFDRCDHVDLPLSGLESKLYLIEIQTDHGIARKKLITE